MQNVTRKARNEYIAPMLQTSRAASRLQEVTGPTDKTAVQTCGHHSRFTRRIHQKKELILTFQLHWLLFVPSTSTLTNSTFCPCSVFVSMDLRTKSNYVPRQH